PAPVRLIPLAEIDDTALTRDRSGLDAEALAELRHSIAASGLRMPVELFALPDPRPPHRFGLISGLRRLHAMRALHALTAEPRYAAIPAFLRAPAPMAETLAAMVEENEIRAPLSPWEQGRIAWLAREQGVFATIEDAVTRLFPAASAAKRSRLRSLAHLAEALEGTLSAPERLSLRQCLRLAAAVNAGWAELIRTALEHSSRAAPEDQWEVVLPILAEAEHRRTRATPATRPDRPRRLARPREGLTIRREMTRDGWCLHFTGREATSGLMDDVFGEIERLFGPG
ncbi:MAG: ParB/RepB/Spo0J family partition protein, partial [Thermohalobaculum sp.]|nr:ParB/RepB/Spo0J family partition protein [Thermohalobaculum sp.]